MQKSEPPKNIEDIVLAYQRGDKCNFLFFWGHKQKNKNVVTKSCFSNWYPASFKVDEEIYPTAEHFMMAEKARLFGDLAIRDAILQTEMPREAQKLGRKVQGFRHVIWEKYRYEIVVQGNYAKFSQNEHLKEFLLSTCGKILVEASPNDSIWGIGLAESSMSAEDPEKWQGLNLLGFALMEVREILR